MRRSTRTSQHRQATLELRAWEMRRAPTPSERVLWAAIRGGRLGTQFRRQVIIAERYIADFLASREKLIVEVDGGYHAERAAVDARRERVLRRLGYRVLRLPAELVLAQLPVALEHIRAAL